MVSFPGVPDPLHEGSEDTGLMPAPVLESKCDLSRLKEFWDRVSAGTSGLQAKWNRGCFFFWNVAIQHPNMTHSRNWTENAGFHSLQGFLGFVFFYDGPKVAKSLIRPPRLPILWVFPKLTQH